MLTQLKSALKQEADSQHKKQLQRFFKMGPGQYAHGDLFIGVRVPLIRKIAKKYRTLSMEQINQLIQSKIHEERFSALVILIHKYQQTICEQEKKTIFDFYVSNMSYINNWDLVDISAPHIIGAYLANHSPVLLSKWAKHSNMWYRRVAMVSTFYFIRQDSFEQTFKIAKLLLRDKEDLIHKAVGWMLREVWKRDHQLVEDFLEEHYCHIPRTTLRYAIERCPEKRRKYFLAKSSITKKG